MENKMITLQASPLPVKTWHYLKINDTQIAVPEKTNGLAACKIDCAKSIQNEKTSVQNATKLLKDKKIVGALGENAEKWFFDQNPDTYVLTAKNDSEITHVNVELSGSNDFSGLFVIDAKKNSKSKFIFETRSDDEATGFAVLYILCNLEENAQVEISQVQLLGKKACYLSDIGATQDEKSKLTIVRSNFGSEKSWLGIQTDLKGKESELDSQLAYMAKNNQVLDINDIARQHGKRSLCNFNTQGVMLDAAYKNYKGTIDLIRGCAGSTGNEMEDVLLLSDDVINKTTPLILCDEEDVVGNHGATLGKIDSSLLFYMQSRGISEETAKQLIASGKLYNIVSKIPNEKLVADASSYIDQAFTY